MQDLISLVAIDLQRLYGNFIIETIMVSAILTIASKKEQGKEKQNS